MEKYEYWRMWLHHFPPRRSVRTARPEQSGWNRLVYLFPLNTILQDPMWFQGI